MNNTCVVMQRFKGVAVIAVAVALLTGCSTTATQTASTTTTRPITAIATPEPPPAPTDAEVVSAFQSYIDERANSGVMLAESVTSVTSANGIVTVTINPSPAVLELSPFDNQAELFGSPVAFNDDESVWLRQTVQRVDVIDAGGRPLGSMTAAELNERAVG